jgi:hypothetical protein
MWTVAHRALKARTTRSYPAHTRAPYDVMRLSLHCGAQPWLGHIKKSTSKPKFVLIHPPARLFA